MSLGAFIHALPLRQLGFLVHYQCSVAPALLLLLYGLTCFFDILPVPIRNYDFVRGQIFGILCEQDVAINAGL